MNALKLHVILMLRVQTLWDHSTVNVMPDFQGMVLSVKVGVFLGHSHSG